jgi:hypothetical protein
MQECITCYYYIVEHYAAQNVDTRQCYIRIACLVALCDQPHSGSTVPLTISSLSSCLDSSYDLELCSNGGDLVHYLKDSLCGDHGRRMFKDTENMARGESV